MKVLALTSIRSDYDLLYPLYKLLNQDEDIDFKLLVSGAHLSEHFGLTKKHIEADGFDILLEIETLINSDTLKSKLKTASLFLQNSIDVVASYNPDLILYAGDREDVIMGGLLGLYLKIPTIHFYGGDHEMAGHEDTVIRHATSKLSTYHFVSTQEHGNRLLKMGESLERIFNIGSIALDRFTNFIPMSLEKIGNVLGIENLNKRNIALLIYHPSPNLEEDNALIFGNILKVLEDNGIFTFVSYPNTDKNHEKILQIIEEWNNNSNFYFFKNLERNLFLSVFKKSQFIIGNSSAGMLEAASIPIPAINVGARQTGRTSNDNVVFIGTSRDEIDKNIKKVLSVEFLDRVKGVRNIYGDGNSAHKAYELIKTMNLKERLNKTEDPLCM